MVHGLYENTHDNKLCNFKSNVHESSYQSKKKVIVIWNWSAGELCGHWPFCFHERNFGRHTKIAPSVPLSRPLQIMSQR